jgi:dihydropteroate synthase
MSRQMLVAGSHQLSLDRPLIMGIVNVTPDSFSDGGLFASTDAAIAHARSLVDEGADILDIGGESTRPGAAPVTERDELARVIPVIEAARDLGVPISVDTQKPNVMREAILAGASIVNDVLALRSPGAMEVCAASDVTVCLMHMQGEPRTMQSVPRYADVVGEVKQFLLERVDACVGAGISQDRIVIDPGIGFGKSLEHNLALLQATAEFAAIGYPVLVGVSRKSMFKALLDLETNDRVLASVVTAVLCAQRGASILRVHDVRETRQALSIMHAIEPS